MKILCLTVGKADGHTLYVLKLFFENPFSKRDLFGTISMYSYEIYLRREDNAA